MAAILPMASRQAADSYNLTHGSASLSNSVEMGGSAGLFEPSDKNPWWFSDDYAVNVTGGATGAYVARRTYAEFYDYWMRRNANERFSSTVTAGSLPGRATQEFVVCDRETKAMGYCMDPLYCATSFNESWIYPAAYTHQRQSFTQRFIRRSRMPFFDEQLALPAAAVGTNNSFGVTTVFNFPRLLRVSLQGGVSGTLPLPQSLAVAMQTTSGDSDLIQASWEEDKSLGALRGFNMTSTSPSSAYRDVGSVSLMLTITPSEEEEPGTATTAYNVSTVVFSNRGNQFEAAPTYITLGETLTKAEKVCFATADSTNNRTSGPNYTSLSDLPSSGTGGLTVKLWSDSTTDSKISINDWILLSRRIQLNDKLVGSDTLISSSGTPSAALETPTAYKVIHRHRWYRVIGIDNNDKWPRVVRLAGDTWDYPETYQSNLARQTSNPNVIIFNTLTSYTDVATTATIVPNVVTVLKSIYMPKR